MEEKILENLNEEQKEAVIHQEGPVLIIAGPGTGKTMVITKRIGWLILNKKIKPEEILALTFTEKAAEEMEERVDKLLPYGYLELFISTFHSFCERMLREHSLDIGLSPNFRLLSQAEQAFLVCQNFDRFSLDYYKPLGNPYKFIKSLLFHFSRAKDEMVTPKEYLDYALNSKLDEGTLGGIEILSEEKKRLKEIAEAYDVYQKLLYENEALDFGDLILFTLKLFKERPLILKKYQEKFKYVLVDEFQDTNWAQYELLKLLTKGDSNLMVVADPKQAIYRWRGASYSNIYQIKKDFPKIKTIYLKSNYRSHQNILDLSGKFIGKHYEDIQNLNEELKRLFIEDLKAVKEGQGEIVFKQTETQEAQASFVTQKILELKEKDPKLSFNDFAILLRTNAQAESFCETLGRAEIPYQFLAKSGLYNKPIVLDIISYFKLLDNYHESNAFYRLLNSPLMLEKISNEDLADLIQYTKRKGVSFYQAAKNASLIPLTQKGVKALFDFISLISKHTEMAKTKPASLMVYSFLQETGYLEILKKRAEESLEGMKEIAFLNQFLKRINEFERTAREKTVHSFLQLVETIFEVGENEGLGLEEEMGPESVKVLTVHSAKGLEFKYVFMPDLVEHKFPTINRSEPISLPDELIKEILPPGDAHLQEERRLFYVGMTRAAEGLYLIAASDYGGKRKKRLSPFLYELELTAEEAKAKEILSALELLAPPKKNIWRVERKYKLPSEFSFSQYAAFKICPLQYKYAFILKLPRRESPSLSFGKTIHNTFYQYLKENLEKTKRTQNSLFREVKQGLLNFKRLEEVYEKCWLDEWYQNEEEQGKFKERGKEMLKNFYEDLTKENPKVRELEFSFNFRMGPHLIKGKIDRIDEIPEGLEFIDYKTGRPKKGTIEDKEQLIIYQMAGEERFREKISRLSYFYPITGEKQSFLATLDEKEKTKTKVLAAIEAINKGDFKPRAGKMCDWCDFKDICEYRLT